jgi:AraC family transcriptional regulator, regulatory protein of adaptative response / methylated-DNA-[protein]-cysteine methyltransferase
VDNLLPLRHIQDKRKLKIMPHYQKIKEVVEFISTYQQAQPSVEAIAKACGLTNVELHTLFKAWCGLTPMGFLQALTLNHAREMLKNEASVLETTYETGLSSPSRLHDLFVTHEAMSPGEYKNGIEMIYGFHVSPFGTCIVVVTKRGVAGLGFCEVGEEVAALQDMQSRWPKAQLRLDIETTSPYAQRIFTPALWQPETPLRLTFIGTDFEVSVWESLLKIPMGQATTYGTIAGHVMRPKAARAVGAAVGKNPISFVVPCHRVLGKSGALTGYHWGLTRKQAMLGWEKGRVSS